MLASLVTHNVSVTEVQIEFIVGIKYQLYILRFDECLYNRVIIIIYNIYVSIFVPLIILNSYVCKGNFIENSMIAHPLIFLQVLLRIIADNYFSIKDVLVH